ncbi:MAG: branched-chain amino acid aminotransferase [Gammaproteobacteria bacterium]|nr:branched-chain amino acid aminotransferase [Gammaproteobacteria bacterium]
MAPMHTSVAERAEVASYDVAPGVGAALKNFVLPEKLGFGPVSAPVMFSAEWSNGAWGRGELVPYGAIQILPGARALQYAELVFEGLKAYRSGEANPNLFRPRDNWQRLARSAQRLSMPPVPEPLFFEAIEVMVGACHHIIPRESGRSLYLRPFLFGTEAGYLLRNSTTFRFMVIGNPVEIYSSGPMRVAIERDDVRAAVGGVGTAKASANYAASLRASNAAVARGLTVALWLDAREQRFIQELSGMNLFAVIGGELHTPALDGAILAGITRDSLITLARHLGFAVHERPMPIDELLAQIASGECTEVFACGTAAILSPIGVLADRDQREYVPIRIDAVAAQLREALLAIQERRAPDPFGWTREVAPLSV